jgi:hypothetical protein
MKPSKNEEQHVKKSKNEEQPAKKKKVKEVTVVEIKHSKSQHERDINPATGSRFSPNTSAQTALDIVVAGAAKGLKAKEIRKQLAEYREENGKDRNLDAGYFPFVVASHPDYFTVKSDGTVEQIKEFEPDPEAAKKMAAKASKRQEKKEARDPKAKLKAKAGKVAKGGKPVLAK